VIYLVDTNVLLRFADRTHPLHPTVRAAVRKLRTGGHKLRTAPQNFVEFWNVVTRPTERNGFGLVPAKVTDFCVLWSGFFLSYRIRLRCTLNGVGLSFPLESRVSKYTMRALWLP
jgi:predicted nucleic acid-binding protein